MIKKCFLFLLFLFTTVFAAALDYAHLQNYNAVKKDFFQKLISGEEANIMICVQYGNTDIDEETATNIVFEAIYNWLDKVKYFISINKEKDKFDDVLNIVARADIKTVPCDADPVGHMNFDGAADIAILFTRYFEYKGESMLPNGTFGKFMLNEGNIIIKTAQKYKHKNYVWVLTHEFGHAFGLADEYNGTIYQGSFLYNSKVRRPTIMDTRSSKQVTCDDADGFITSMDRLNETPRTFYSLCKDGILIEDGKGVEGTDTLYEFFENYYEFDAYVKVLYNTKDEDKGDYTVDLVLDKFILDKPGLKLLNGMGFKVDTLREVRRSVVTIHGAVEEAVSEEDFKTIYKKPVGLWTLVLYKRTPLRIIPIQSVSKDYSDPDSTPVCKNLEDDSFYSVSEGLLLPLITYFPSMDYGVKEMLRKKNIFRLNPRVPKKTTIENTVPNESTEAGTGNT